FFGVTSLPAGSITVIVLNWFVNDWRTFCKYSCLNCCCSSFSLFVNPSFFAFCANLLMRANLSFVIINQEPLFKFYVQILFSSIYKNILVFNRKNRQELQLFLSVRSEEHTSELQSRFDLVCRL